MTYRLTPVPDGPLPFIAAEDFPAIARDQWDEAKSAYADAFQSTSSLHYLLHNPGQVRVSGTVTGALHEAKKLRDAADRLVVAFGTIVETGKRVSS
jgi:hypothetical protein